MACRYTYQGKTYEAHEFDDVLRAMKPAEASKFMPSVQSIPDAPMIGKTDAWVSLALKRIIKMAVDEGYDKVALINGQQSIDRYWSHPVIEGAVGRWNEVTKPESIRELGENVLGRKMTALMSLDVVDGGVLGVLKHDQVAKAVVSRLPVDVVNVLSANGIKPEQLLRNGDVVLDRLPVNDRSRAASAVGSAIRETSTAIRAKLGGLEAGGRDVEILPALSASDLGPRELAGLLDPARLFHRGTSNGTKETAAAGAVTEPLAGSEGRKGANEQRAAELASLLNAHAEIIHGREGLLQHGFEAPPSEGMKAFYDKIVPSVAKDVLRKLGGGQMETVKIVRDMIPGIDVSPGQRSAEQPGFTITPAMREHAAQGMPLFKRSEFSDAAKSQATDSVERLTKEITSNWANAPKVVVAFDLNDPRIPEFVRREDQKQRSGGASGTPEGFFYKGTAYLMASQLKTPQDTARVLFHEALGHYGLRNVFGDSLNPILKQVAAMHRPEVEAKMKEYGLRGVNNLDRLTAAEEVLAELAQTRPNLGLVQRAIAAVRTWLRENVPGFKDLNLSDAELIRDYILPARGWVERGRQAQARDGAPAFNRGKNEDMTNTNVVGNQGGRSADDNSNGVSQFQQRMTAAQELADSVKETGQRLAINADGTITVFHSTSSANVATIQQEGKFIGNTWFGASKSATMEHAKPKHGADTETLAIKVDPRGIEFSTGTGEFYAPDGLTRNEHGVWSNEPTAPDSGGAQTASNPDIRYSRTNTETMPPAKPSAWRDVAGRPVFAPGQALYSLIGKATNPLLVKLQLKAASPELRHQLLQMKLDVQKAQDVAVAVAHESQKLSPAERLMVSDIIEKELAAGTVPPEHAIRLATAMNTAMGEQTKELIRLGMLTPETAAHWDGRYLPRFYESKLKKQAGDAWADAARSLGFRPKSLKGIKGKHLKGRGLYETVPESQLANYEAMGWEVRDPDYTPSLPSVDGTVQVWRDFTRAERDAMGEIRDAGFRFVMGYMQTQRDIALGKMYEVMATDDKSSSRLPREGWVRVPDSTVEGTGAKRYGKLAGRFVPMETLSHLTNIEEAQSAAWRMYRSAMAVWKEGKTALNPVSHVNNVLSNLTMAHFAGIGYHRWDKYAAAIKDFTTGAPMMKEARDSGLFLGTMSDAELMNTMPPELKALATQAESKTQQGAKAVYNAMTFWLRKPMGAAYQAEDTFFRYLIYKDARARGVDPNDAVDYAQKYIFTYDDLPKGARMIRDFGIPFFAYTYKAIPALLNTALTRPDRFAAPAAVLWAANAAAYAIAAGGDDDDDWMERLTKYLQDPEYRAKVREKEQLEREHLPPWMKGTTALFTPRAIRLGTDELTKLPLFIDTSRIIPGGDIFDVSPNAGGLPIPQPFTPSHPLFTTAVAMIGNKDLFFGKDIIDSNDTRAEATAKRADWLWKQMTPAIAVGNYHWERGMNALAQATGGEVKWMPDMLGGDATGIGRDGNPVQLKYAAMQTFGIKVRPIDLDTAEQIDMNQRNKMVRDIDAEMKKLMRLNSIGAIPDRTLDTAYEKAQVKKERIKEGLTVDGEDR